MADKSKVLAVIEATMLKTFLSEDPDHGHFVDVGGQRYFLPDIHHYQVMLGTVLLQAVSEEERVQKLVEVLLARVEKRYDPERCTLVACMCYTTPTRSIIVVGADDRQFVSLSSADLKLLLRLLTRRSVQSARLTPRSDLINEWLCDFVKQYTKEGMAKAA